MGDASITSADLKRRVGSRVHTKAHFAMSSTDAKRTSGSCWNRHLVNGTVVSCETDTSGKRANVFVNVSWELPGDDRIERVNVRSVRAGEAPSTVQVTSSFLNASNPSTEAPEVEEEGSHQQDVGGAYSRAESTSFGIGGHDLGGCPTAVGTLGLAVATRPSSDQNVQEETSCDVHGVTWRQKEIIESVGGAVPRRVWSMATSTGETILEGGDSGPSSPPRRPFDYFMAVFPHAQLVKMVQ